MRNVVGIATALGLVCALGAAPAAVMRPTTRIPAPLRGLVLGPVSSARVGPASVQPAMASGSYLSTAFPLGNLDAVPASDFKIATASLSAGAVTVQGIVMRSPAAIPPAASARAFVAFPNATTSGIALMPRRAYLLTVAGTYTARGLLKHFVLKRTFTVPPSAPGSAIAMTARAAFVPIAVPHARSRSARGAVESVQPSGWSVPLGPPRTLHRTIAPVVIKTAPPPLADPPLEVFSNNLVSSSGALVNEPSGAISTATGGGVVVATFNSAAAFSTNGGLTWAPLNPGALGNADGGFCCDQVVQFVPGFNIFVWVLQTRQPANAPNRERILVASPSTVIATKGASWRRLDITPAVIHRGSQDLLDFPDLSVGNTFLYLSFDDVSGPLGSFGWGPGEGLEVVRMPLAQLAAGKPQVDISFTNPNDSQQASLGHVTQSPRDAIFWAGHNSNSSIRVFAWPESSPSYSWHDVDLGSWSNDLDGMSSTTPDGQDWLTKLRTNGAFPVLGAVRLAPGINSPVDTLLLAWTAARGEGFAQPQIQWISLAHSDDFSSWSLVSQQQIFDPVSAIAYPALAVNSSNEVGLSLELGGGDKFENHAIGFLTDLQTGVFVTTNSDTGSSRFGDYTTIRRDPNVTGNFDAFGYGITGGAAITRMIVFGRPAGAVPTFNRITIRIDTGNDDAGSGVEIVGVISGQPHTFCLKPSSSLPPDDVCPNHSGATDQNNKSSWDNGTSSKQTFPLPSPQSRAALATLTIVLRQSGCGTSCDNWDIQGINVVASDTSGHLPPATLINLAVPLNGDNCIARLKGPPNATTVRFGLDGSQSHVYVDGQGPEPGAVTTCKNNGD